MGEETLEVLVTLAWFLIPIVFTIGLIKQSLGEQDVHPENYDNPELDRPDDEDRAA
ncbi:hypothetical protein [Halobacteriovorax sp. JY17]|uniref:hypothetical protein n=1 Tax=Halobacteriovorax sp. JY17 TaxID=2014617 RepID=UPI0025C33640|nr:hypothetical protein [Halobacteriovorax sp. JY17]